MPNGLRTGDHLLIATSNAGKFAEFEPLLKTSGLVLISGANFGLKLPPEDGISFAANAEHKVRAATQQLQNQPPAHHPTPWILADDSGLCLPTLADWPGIVSARIAETPLGRDFRAAGAAIHQRLQDNPDRRARLVTALVLRAPNGSLHHYSSELDGQFIWPPRGEDSDKNYFAMFQPEGHQLTLAEMTFAARVALLPRRSACNSLIREMSQAAQPRSRQQCDRPTPI